MEIRNILTYRGRLNFKRLSDADLQLLDCWCKGVVFGSLHVIQVKPNVFYITPRVNSDIDFVCHVACRSCQLVKMLNYYKNNSFKYPDFKSFLFNKFPDIHILKYVS